LNLVTLSGAIAALGGMLFAALLAVAIRSERRRSHPWSVFADEHGLTYRELEDRRRLEGEHSGRELEARGTLDGSSGEWMTISVPLSGSEWPEATIRRGSEDSGEAGLERLSFEESEGESARYVEG